MGILYDNLFEFMGISYGNRFELMFDFWALPCTKPVQWKAER